MNAATHSAAPIPARFARLWDDAAVFPPSSAPLPEAVAAHLRHRAAPYAGLVGPLVVAGGAVAELPPLLDEHPGATLEVSVTVSSPAELTSVIERAAALPAVRLVALEVALPADLPAADVVPAIDAALDAVPGAAPGGPDGQDLQVYVEVPRDDRRPELLELLAASKHRAKFRTGGVEAQLYPDEAELADAVDRAVRLRLPFKASAGLHHALRNTDPHTGFEHHGFLNLLLATAAALRGEPGSALERLLAERDGAGVASAVAALSEENSTQARELFVSFGTCSVADPLTELARWGLVPAELAEPAGGAQPIDAAGRAAEETGRAAGGSPPELAAAAALDVPAPDAAPPGAAPAGSPETHR